MLITLDALRRFAVARSLFKPTTLKFALDRLGFVQADPIRAPARAQDLILRHRVKVLRRRSRTPVPKAWYRRGFLCRLWFRLNAYTGADASAFEGRRAGRRL